MGYGKDGGKGSYGSSSWNQGHSGSNSHGGGGGNFQWQSIRDCQQVVEELRETQRAEKAKKAIDEQTKEITEKIGTNFFGSKWQKLQSKFGSAGSIFNFTKKLQKQDSDQSDDGLINSFLKAASSKSKKKGKSRSRSRRKRSKSRSRSRKRRGKSRSSSSSRSRRRRKRSKSRGRSRKRSGKSRKSRSSSCSRSRRKRSKSKERPGRNSSKQSPGTEKPVVAASGFPTEYPKQSFEKICELFEVEASEYKGKNLSEWIDNIKVLKTAAQINAMLTKAKLSIKTERDKPAKIRQLLEHYAE